MAGRMLSDEEIRSRIAESYGPQITSCDRLLTLARNEMANWSGRPVKRGADRIILAEVSRATKTFDALIRLCRDGFGEQAAMLNRSLFEAMVIAHWTSIHRREAVGLFVRHAQFTSGSGSRRSMHLAGSTTPTEPSAPRSGPRSAPSS
jgi:hypothetical protein